MLRQLLVVLLALATCTGAVRQFYQDNAFLELVRAPMLLTLACELPAFSAVAS